MNVGEIKASERKYATGWVDPQMEKCARLGTAYDPNEWPLDPSPDPFPHERGKFRWSVVFAMLAALAIAFGIGAALP